ncbi:hypothetical protein CRI94_17135 [Longibacter salinarum]|uniref:FecR protein domain-containing protein n=1 Tax=Longibacter salinarum TaxID=1850348 RepID=A0A2A8CTN1_9BACT|nr:FecR domain-containing protein [Longibacter salinarum]PEN10952.1 hypothetical protein CRI94_17135 [Longibacter salinarum]
MSRNRLPFPENLQEHLPDEEEQSSLKSVWRLLGLVDDAPTENDRQPDVDAAWEAVRQRAFAEPEPHAGDDRQPVRSTTTPNDRAPRSRRDGSRWNRSSVLTGASILVAVLVVGFGLWWQQPVSVQAPVGEQRTASLPDGSTIELNSGTTLRYQRGFASLPGLRADRRSVELDGEAYFSVVHGDRPFEVRTFNSRVEVLGTEFNIRARDGKTTEVVVTSGRVRVESTAAESDKRSAHATDKGIVLDEPGERSRVTDAVESPSTVDVSRVLAWRRAGFAVSDQPLSSIVAELQRRYDRRVRLTPSARAQGGSLSLYYNSKVDPETIIHDICTAQGLAYRPINGGFEIYVEDAIR